MDISNSQNARVPAPRPLIPAVPLAPPIHALPAESHSWSITDYGRLLLRYKWLLAIMAVLGSGAGLLLTLPQTPVYQARATLEVQGLNENFLNMGAMNPTTSSANGYFPELDMQTHMKLLQSRSVINGAVERYRKEGLKTEAAPTGRWSALRRLLRIPESRSANTAGAELGMAAGTVQVRSTGQTRLFEVTSDSTNPAVAARFLNTLSQEFIDQNLEARWKTTQRTSDFLTRQLQEVKVKLQAAEQNLQSYAHSAGLLFVDEKSSVAEDRLKQFQEELSKAQADRVAKQSRYEMALSSPPESLPDIIEDPALRDYKGKLIELQRQLAETASSYTAEHPKLRKVQAQINTIQTELTRDRARIVERIKNDFRAAERREKLLLADYETQSRVITGQNSKMIQYNILKREVDTTRQLYDMMLQKVKESGIASALRASNIRVVDPAEPPGGPYKPDPFRGAAVGVFGGLALGVLLVYWREHADRTLQGPGDVPLYLQLPELGVIPSAKADIDPAYGKTHIPASGEKRDECVELVARGHSSSALAESFRDILASIVFLHDEDKVQTLSITSCNPSEGKSTLVSNIGIALAQIGRRVLIIDADLRRPRMHTIFGIDNGRGLSDFLLRTNEHESGGQFIHQTEVPNLFLFPAGANGDLAWRLLHSERLPQLLEWARFQFDMVIVDTPPVLNMADSRVVGRMVDGVIMVVRSGKTTRDRALSVSQRLLGDGVRILGAVLNGWNPRKAKNQRYGYGQYGYGYGYGYSYGYGRNKPKVA